MSAKEQPARAELTREAILRALGALSDELGKQDVTGEICLFGGTVMVLAFTARVSTQDVNWWSSERERSSSRGKLIKKLISHQAAKEGDP